MLSKPFTKSKTQRVGTGVEQASDTKVTQGCSEERTTGETKYTGGYEQTGDSWNQ